MPLKSLYDGVGYLTTTYMEVKKLVDENPEHITESDSFGMIPLHYASLYGAPLKIVKYLIQQDEKHNEGFEGTRRKVSTASCSTCQPTNCDNLDILSKV